MRGEARLRAQRVTSGTNEKQKPQTQINRQSSTRLHLCANVCLDLNVSIRGPQRSYFTLPARADVIVRWRFSVARAAIGCQLASLNPLSKQVDVSSLQQGQFKASYVFCFFKPSCNHLISVLGRGYNGPDYYYIYIYLFREMNSLMFEVISHYVQLMRAPSGWESKRDEDDDHHPALIRNVSEDKVCHIWPCEWAYAESSLSLST